MRTFKTKLIALAKLAHAQADYETNARASDVSRTDIVATGRSEKSWAIVFAGLVLLAFWQNAIGPLACYPRA